MPVVLNLNLEVWMSRVVDLEGSIIIEIRREVGMIWISNVSFSIGNCLHGRGLMLSEEFGLYMGVLLS